MILFPLLIKLSQYSLITYDHIYINMSDTIGLKRSFDDAFAGEDQR